MVASTSQRSQTILFAEDEPVIRRLAEAVLNLHGYQVLPAVDGQEAVEIYQREKEKIDLVILDLLMPRLSGHDAFQQIRQLNPEARVLFASGFADGHITAEEQAAAVGIVAKPYRPDDLAKTVRSVLDKNEV